MFEALYLPTHITSHAAFSLVFHLFMTTRIRSLLTGMGFTAAAYGSEKKRKGSSENTQVAGGDGGRVKERVIRKVKWQAVIKGEKRRKMGP